MAEQKSTKTQKSIRISPITLAKLMKLKPLYGTQTSTWEAAITLLYRKHYGEEAVKCIS